MEPMPVSWHWRGCLFIEESEVQSNEHTGLFVLYKRRGYGEVRMHLPSYAKETWVGRSRS